MSVAQTGEPATTKPTMNNMAEPQMNLPRTLVTIRRPGAKEINLEVQVAVSQKEQAKGLMFRRHLPQSEGMLFVYHKEQELGFYMANCFISLDMIFMDKDQKVVGTIENARPMDETVRSIGRPSQYVLEVNGGFAARHHITNGTVITWREWNR
ncbi:DUF192 domain-containing protein [Myxococcota bacterium]|nr:DUF192 domain-containing protein [Myxococcota bacterium]MBU1533818.1 DUF192 domain-containing protein [Myxococcota bacterium]